MLSGGEPEAFEGEGGGWGGRSETGGAMKIDAAGALGFAILGELHYAS